MTHRRIKVLYANSQTKAHYGAETRRVGYVVRWGDDATHAVVQDAATGVFWRVYYQDMEAVGADGGPAK
jgi:hypothetical protein